MTPMLPTSRPRVLFLAAIILLAEALVALGFGVLEATQIRPSRLVVGAGTALLMVGYGAFLAAVGRGVGYGRRWSRGPAVATQLLHLPIAWSFNGGNTIWVAWTLMAASVVVLGCLVAPASTATFLGGSAGAAADAPVPGRSRRDRQRR
ncbi:MAG TPA: hypothetical protein VFP89_00230 [Propionibacteriaceae bacterium]|nr:hypothetical protein [Propionibacteriaceae bacterium]